MTGSGGKFKGWQKNETGRSILKAEELKSIDDNAKSESEKWQLQELNNKRTSLT